MDYKVILTKDLIDVNSALQFINSPYCGGTSVFIGTTRLLENVADEKNVKHLIYEAYEEMAIKLMENIVEKQMNSFDVHHKIFVCHRLGQVNVGEQSILIAVSSPHRSSGHQMVMQILNEIKEKVPIWKKVFYDEDNSVWSDKSEAFWLKS